MPKAGELDWSDLMQKSEEPVNDVGQSNKGGEKITKSQLQADADFIRKGFQQKGIRQPTDQEMFGHLVPSEEQVQKAEQDWHNVNKGFEELKKPIDNKTTEWGNGKPLVDWENMSEEEKAKRNSYVGSDSDLE